MTSAAPPRPPATERMPRRAAFAAWGGRQLRLHECRKVGERLLCLRPRIDAKAELLEASINQCARCRADDMA